MSENEPQGFYQVRFDWGVAGFQALAAGADVVVIADALPALRPPAEPATPLRAHRVIRAGLHNRTAVARWVLDRQAEKGDRFSVAVIAAADQRPDGTERWAVEDLLAAGAVVDALTGVGIDHCSPEAAAASAAFVGLKQAVKHLVGASETGQALADAGRRGEVQAAVRLDDTDDVPELGEFHFAG